MTRPPAAPGKRAQPRGLQECTDIAASSGDAVESMDTDLLRRSFTLLTKREQRLADRFYTLLFERYPATRLLFRGRSARAKGTMLLDALVLLMANLDDEVWVQDNLAALGLRHRGYGVAPEMYGWFGEVLLATFREGSGEAWTPELEAAWTEAYQIISSRMVREVPAQADLHATE